MDNTPPPPSDVPPTEPEPVTASTDPTPPMTATTPQTTAGPVMTGAVSQDEKTQAILCWVLSLFIGIVSPLIFYLISKEKPFTYRHAAECLTVHIVVLVGYLIAGALCVIGIGLVLMPIVLIYALVITIMGAIAASNGQPYDPPITAPWATKMFGV